MIHNRTMVTRAKGRLERREIWWDKCGDAGGREGVGDMVGWEKGKGGFQGWSMFCEEVSWLGRCQSQGVEW
jgi:hypothetical protein